MLPVKFFYDGEPDEVNLMMAVFQLQKHGRTPEQIIMPPEKFFEFRDSLGIPDNGKKSFKYIDVLVTCNNFYEQEETIRIGSDGELESSDE